MLVEAGMWPVWARKELYFWNLFFFFLKKIDLDLLEICVNRERRAFRRVFSQVNTLAEPHLLDMDDILQMLTHIFPENLKCRYNKPLFILVTEAVIWITVDIMDRRWVKWNVWSSDKVVHSVLWKRENGDEGGNYGRGCLTLVVNLFVDKKFPVPYYICPL
jgi:hypothetical protein